MLARPVSIVTGYGLDDEGNGLTIVSIAASEEFPPNQMPASEEEFSQEKSRERVKFFPYSCSDTIREHTSLADAICSEAKIHLTSYVFWS